MLNVQLYLEEDYFLLLIYYWNNYFFFLHNYSQLKNLKNFFYVYLFHIDVMLLLHNKVMDCYKNVEFLIYICLQDCDD